MKNVKIVVRGGGDLATGVIHRLWSAGFKVLVLECAQPSVIRHQVAVADAVYNGKACVEGLQAELIADLQQAEAVWDKKAVPILIDETGKSLNEFAPDILVDAIIAKRNLGTKRSMAPLTIALGPGFCAGQDVDYVIETKRGHNLGRIIKEGYAAPNSGIPGIIAGYGKERVLHSPAVGSFHVVKDVGQFVEQGEIIAEVLYDNQREPIKASLTGIIRGMLREGYPVTTGFKVADIDPRKEELQNCYTISDKARCIAGSVLELATAYMLRN